MPTRTAARQIGLGSIGCRGMEFTNVFTVIYLLAALHLAHRALVAALIFANPAAEIRRLPALIGTTLWPFVFAQRACCAAEIFARADALILRGPRDPPQRSNPLRAVIAASSALNCPAIFALSSFNCEMMSIVPPRGEDCNRVPAILRANHCNPNRTLRVLASIAALPDRFSRRAITPLSVRFSRDGLWMVYVSIADNTLWRSRIDGSERLQLTFPPMNANFVPAWSPDGSQIAFAGSISGGLLRIFRISRDGGNPEQLTEGKHGGGDVRPSWSPDGKTLVFGEYSSSGVPVGNPMYVWLLDLETRK